MNLSQHFTLAELTNSQLAARFGIFNDPPINLWPNLRKLAAALEEVRVLLNAPMHINSGYRCLELNKLLGSKPTSAHVQGLGADFIAPQFGSPAQVCAEIARSDIEFDQVIYEFGAWTHLGLRDEPRRQVLTIDAKGARLGLP
ncbi:MAG: D-Ala-D-Ala carboxypeptidase family metallohydrolase [Sulfuricaulis sp.]|nr:D-Ala-D-Ala carboxypeptidase family metallohydrolase [Sulfuricaulis sp.]